MAIADQGNSTFPPDNLRKNATEIVELLKKRGETVAVAETAAGGLISASLLAVPGASKVYKGGLTLYTLPSRIAYAGWTQANIDNYDGPTPDLVGGLADHVRGDLKATYVIGESGTAGPTGSGEAENRQPGYAAIAVSTEGKTYKGELRTKMTDREQNMVAFAAGALNFLKLTLEGTAKPNEVAAL